MSKVKTGAVSLLKILPSEDLGMVFMMPDLMISMATGTSGAFMIAPAKK
jgi:hypothetical protein